MQNSIKNNRNGKGSAPRKVDLKKYGDNYDLIWKKKRTKRKNNHE